MLRKASVVSMMLFLSMFCGLCVTDAARADDAFVTATLPGGSVGFASSPDSGAVAIVDVAGHLTIYPKLLITGTLEGAVADKAATVFDAVTYKRVAGAKSGYFLAGSSAAQSLFVFDETTLVKVKSFPIAATGKFAVAASTDERDPYVVCGNGARNEGVHRINLRTLADEGTIQFGDMMSPPMEISVSGDGALLYTRATSVSPSGVRCWQILPAKQPGVGFVAAIRHSEHNTRPMYVPDALGQFVACGTTLFSADMTATIGEMPVAPVLFHPTRPFFFGFKGDNLVAVSLNTFKEVGLLELSGERIPANQRQQRFARVEMRPGQPDMVKPVLLLDNKHHNLLVCYDTKLVLIPEQSMDLPDEPSLYATIEGSLSVAVGQPLQVKIHKMDARAKVNLDSGPAGLKLVGDQLVWTPGLDSVGTAKVQLKLSAGAASRIQTVEVSVRQTFVTLPFTPDEIRTSEDGDFALLLQYTSPERRNNNPYPGNGGEPYCRIALVRLTAPAAAPHDAGAKTLDPAVIADRTLSSTIVQRSAAVGEGFVFLALQDSDAFLVLSTKDLTDVKRVFAPGRIQAMSAAGGRLYVACNPNNPQGIPMAGKAVFKLPNFEPVPAPREVNQFRFNNNPAAEVPMPDDGGLLYDDVLYDATMTHARLLVGTEGFAASQTVRGVNNMQRFDPYGRPAAAAPWGTVLQGFNLQRVGGQAIGQIAVHNEPGMAFNNGAQIVLLSNVPAAAVLDVSWKRFGNGIEQNGSRLRGEVSFFDLVTCAKAGSVVLMDEASTGQNGYRNGEQERGLIAPARSNLVITIGERLFVLNTDNGGGAIDLTKLPMPLHFVNQQSGFALPADKTLVLSHVVQGGAAPLEFTLAAETPGVEIDKASGKITLDGKLLAPRATDDLYSIINNQYRNIAAMPATTMPMNFNGQNRPATFEMGLAEYMKVAGPKFLAVAGRQPAGTPIALSIGLIARDKDQQTATLNEVVLLEIPNPTLLSRAKAAAAEEQKAIADQQLFAQQQQAQWQAQQGIRRPGVFPTTRPAAGNDGNLQARIAELEAENADLRAKVEVLSELIRNGAAGAPRHVPATRPSGY